MYRKLFVVGSFSLFAAAATAVAQADMSYSYVDLGWQSVDVDGVRDDGDGLFLRGSVAFAEKGFAFAGYRDIEFDFADVEEMHVGIGARHPLNSTTDLFGGVAYVNQDYGPSDDDGFRLSLGLRAQPIANVEVEGAIEYTDLDDGGDDTGLRVGARYQFTPALSAGGEIGYSDDVKDFGIYARYSF